MSDSILITFNKDGTATLEKGRDKVILPDAKSAVEMAERLQHGSEGEDSG